MKSLYDYFSSMPLDIWHLLILAGAFVATVVLMVVSFGMGVVLMRLMIRLISRGASFIRRHPLVTIGVVLAIVVGSALFVWLPPIMIALSILFLTGLLLVIFNRPEEGQARKWDRIFYVSLLATAIAMIVITPFVEEPLGAILYPGPFPSFLWLKTDAIVLILLIILPLFLFWDDGMELMREAIDSFEERSETIRLADEEEQQLQPQLVPGQPIPELGGGKPSRSASWLEKFLGSSEVKFFGKMLPVEVVGDTMVDGFLGLMKRIFKFVE